MTEQIEEDRATFTTDGGYIKVAVVANKNGPECWIYELEAEKDGPTLMARARRQAAEWGFEDVFANVTNPKLAMALRDHGWTLEQVILKGKTRK